ncbi:S41 family peptidase [Mongoliitalea daihaiensis]|uniref:S41 family peptidase n=1 Tax=Mongoliitalea daihaiensis TaxID=2782006 RepID=UPI001F170128|nr:S41 family peptidase [Mongoliitalea daihaiensis]UJP63529.1 carboxyl-terminal protease [Mongoliitalea daihaiensis]
MKRLKIWSLIVAALTIFAACEPKEEEVPQVNQEDQVKLAVFETMREFYYWTNELPLRIDPSEFSTKEEVLEALRFRPLDRFTSFTTAQARADQIVGNVSGVHGIRIAFNQEERLFLASVTRTGPAGQDGWQRGWEIIEINGRTIPSFRNPNGSYSIDLGPNQVGVTNTFKFRLADGSEITRTIPKTAFAANSVAHESIFEMGGKKIGYWVYENFRATPGGTPGRSNEVDESFGRFQAANIDELIIDLRYNGGGLVSVAEQILNLVAPNSANGQVMYTYRWGPNQVQRNESATFRKVGSLNLNRIVFITSRSSASASELVINSLRPFVNTVIIGDNTFGKPVGSIGVANRVLTDNNILIELITFSIANANGDADYFEGFVPAVRAGDDLTRNWGDPQEFRLAAALSLVTEGAVGARLTNTYYRPVWHMHEQFKGLEQEYFMY